MTPFHGIVGVGLLAVVACSSDATCLALPCPLAFAAEITVTASNTPSAVPGLTITGASAACDTTSPAATVCVIQGEPGSYNMVLAAPGYQSTTLNFNVSGTPGGCSRCAVDDTQHISVVMQPAVG